MIIVCGPDNTGKTRLVEHLSKKFNILKGEKYHTLPPTDYSDWGVWVEKALLNVEQSIADRFYVEEFVYGPVMRGKVGIGEYQRRHLDRLFSDRDPIIILCNTSLDNIKRTYGERVQYPEVSRTKEIQDMFLTVLNSYPFRSCIRLRFDYEFDPHYEKIDRDLKYLIGGVASNECE